jgi:hypothetical protein
MEPRPFEKSVESHDEVQISPVRQPEWPPLEAASR